MHIRTLRPADLDAATAAELAGLHNRCRDLDFPHQPVETAETLRLRLLHGWDGEGAERLLVVRDDAARALGFAELEMPERENRGLIWFFLYVDPPARRRGVGTALMQELLAVSGAVGRDLLMSSAWDGTAGEPFLRHHGLEMASVAAKRRLHPHLLPRPGDEELLETARRASAGYELRRIVGPLPEELLATVLPVAEQINDAPLDDLELEDDVFSVERLREYDATQQALHHRLYRILAFDATGTAAAHSVVAVDLRRRHHGEQHDTTVRREHRGHRLGLRLKLEMLAWLREAEPQLTEIDTWNQESNAHMIAVNDAIGCTVVGRELEFQRRVPAGRAPARADAAGAGAAVPGPAPL